MFLDIQGYYAKNDNKNNYCIIVYSLHMHLLSLQAYQIKNYENTAYRGSI